MCYIKSIILFLVIASTAACDQSPKTYSANCSTPLPHWGREKDGTGHLLPVIPVFIGSDGSILYTGRVISTTTLREYMLSVSNFVPEPQIILEVSPSASCDRVSVIRKIMNDAPICKEDRSHCSEGWNYKQWPEYGGP